MSDQRAFALKESAEETFVAAGVSVAGEPVDVKQLLDEGDGVIVTDDVQLLEALEHCEVLKHVSAPKAASKRKRNSSASKTAAKSGGRSKS